MIQSVSFRFYCLLVVFLLLLAIALAAPPIVSEWRIDEKHSSPHVQLYSIPLVESNARYFQSPPSNLVNIIVMRPLFSRSRRREETLVVKSDTEELTFELNAVLMSDPLRAALVRIEGHERPIWIREQGWLSSWQVDEILADRVRLHRRNQVRIIRLQSESSRNKSLSASLEPGRAPTGAQAHLRQ